MFTLLLKWFVGVFAIMLLLATLISYKLEHSPEQAAFLQGTLPYPEPSGFYDGRLSAPNPFWLGKRFNYENDTGINIFKAGAGLNNEGFSFKTYEGKGIANTHLDVLKIDYNTPENPFWVHPLLDEIVQIDENRYLGKMYIKFLPGHPFTMAFFELSR